MIHSVAAFLAWTAVCVLGAFVVLTLWMSVHKSRQLLRAFTEGRRYVVAFEEAGALRSAAELPENDSPFGRVASVGFGILDYLPSGGRDARLGLLERNLRREMQRERERLESGLGFLAGLRAAAPFVGVLGAVWAIVAILGNVAGSDQASLQLLAEPVALALAIAGIGYAAAIPALLAHHFIKRRADDLMATLEDFADDFLSLARRRERQSGARSATPRSSSPPARRRHLTVVNTGIVTP